MRVKGGRGEGKSRERTMPRRAELSEPFSLAFTGEEGGSAPAPPRGEAFPAGDQRRPEHAAVGEQHQLVWLRGRPAPRPRASPTTDPPKPWLWNAGDGEELRGKGSHRGAALQVEPARGAKRAAVGGGAARAHARVASAVVCTTEAVLASMWYSRERIPASSCVKRRPAPPASRNGQSR